MSEPFLGQITMVGFNFAPRGWAHCNGQLIAIAQYSALFSLLGTTYGGDGETTFGFPDLRGRVPIHPGTGPGLPAYSWGQRGGNYQHQLTIQQLPSHNHLLGASASATLKAVNTLGDQRTPGGNALSGDQSGDKIYKSGTTPDADLAADSISLSGTTENNGGGQAHNNMQPYLGIYYVVALQGIFPSEN